MIDLDTVRAAGQQVLERGRLTVRTSIEIPQRGVRLASLHTVDLERALVRTSTTATMAPAAGAATSWMPRQ